LTTRLVLNAVSCAAAGTAVLLSPWLFGAWEQWWFWPFAGCIFLGALAFAGRILTDAGASPPPDTPPPAPPHPWQARPALKSPAALVWLPFLAYALVRSRQAAVAADAEVSLLRFVTPFLLAVPVAFGWSRRQVRALHALLLANLALLALYGLGNHALTGSRLVLWRQGYDQYRGRLTGTCFCPDHFAALMELAYALCLGLLLTRGTGTLRKAAAGVVAVLALATVALTQSRGGGLTVAGISLAGILWGFGQWPPPVRRYLQIMTLCLAGLAAVLFVRAAPSYRQRFVAYFGWDQARGRPLAEVSRVVLNQLQNMDRGLMIGGALRAWRSAPGFGIGPGMHQNLWPHFAAGPDGDRAAGRWPAQPNYSFHSYEVHSDWVQLLEEYGLWGLGLFLPAAAVGFALLRRGLGREQARLAARGWRPSGWEEHAFLLGGLLAAVGMGIHSLGDFSLQIPAVAWVFAATLGIAFSRLEA
jgi:hypothetical protein